MTFFKTFRRFKYLLPAMAIALTAPLLAGGDGHAKKSASETKVGAVVEEFRKSEGKNRKESLKNLVALGREGALSLENYFLDRDESVSALAAEALTLIAGEGKTNDNGLTLSAVQTGHIPAKGETASLWVVMQNDSQSGVYFIHRSWAPTVLPEGADFSKKEERDYQFSNLPKCDFVALRPGETFSCLLLAEVLDSAREADKVYLNLDIPEPLELWFPGAGEQVTGAVSLQSKPFELKIAKEDALCLGKNEGDLLGMNKDEEKFFPVLHSALYSPDEMTRAVAYIGFFFRSGKYLELDYRPELVATAVKSMPTAADMDVRASYISIPGLVLDKRNKKKARRAESALVSIKLLIARSLPAFNEFIIDGVDKLASEDGQFYQKAACAFMRLLHKRGFLPNSLKLDYAWLLLTISDEKVRNPDLARRIAEDIDMVTNVSLKDRLIIAMIENDTEEVSNLVKSVDDEAANNLAWKIATSGRPSRDHLFTALQLSKRSVAATQNRGRAAMYRLDTLAAVYAAIHDFKKAYELQLDATTRSGWNMDYVKRLALYFCLMREEKENLPDSMFDDTAFKSEKVCSAILAELEKSNLNHNFKTELTGILLRDFPDNPAAKKIAGSNQVDDEEEPDIEESEVLW